jgi:hypothetical protein
MQYRRETLPTSAQAWEELAIGLWPALTGLRKREPLSSKVPGRSAVNRNLLDQGTGSESWMAGAQPRNQREAVFK